MAHERRTNQQLEKLTPIEDRGQTDRVAVLANSNRWPWSETSILTNCGYYLQIMTHARANSRG